MVSGRDHRGGVPRKRERVGPMIDLSSSGGAMRKAMRALDAGGRPKGGRSGRCSLGLCQDRDGSTFLQDWGKVGWGLSGFVVVLEAAGGEAFPPIRGETGKGGCRC